VTALVDRLRSADLATYRIVARLATPALDRPLQLVSDLANHSKPWLATAAVLAVCGGPRGRRAALAGIAAVGATSFVVNLPMKRARRRRRPDRIDLGVPATRWVQMPTSTSFPSGHSASAAAFAMSVGHLVPPIRVPLRLAAGVVAFSRVYTGVHYPGDVIVGMAVGTAVGAISGRVAERVRRRRSARAGDVPADDRGGVP
jgi:undecaprenyl-diphosphatase